VRGLTGGAPACSTHCFGPARSSHCARSFDGCVGPNPLVALPYLWKPNTVLLGSLLFWFRFTLTGTIILIPQSLAIHGFEANQIGPAVIWSAAPLLLITFIAALLLLHNLDPRLLLAAGLTCTAFAVYLNAEYTTAWSAANYYRTELLTGVGQAVALIGLVGCIILQGVFSGGLSKPQWILTFSAFSIRFVYSVEPRGPFIWAIFLPPARNCTRIFWVCT